MKHIRIGLTVALICAWAIPAGAAMHWQAVPHKMDMMHAHDALHSFRLIDGEGANLSLMRPDLTKASIAADANGHVEIKPDGMSFFHVLIAIRNDSDATTTAIRYFDMFGKPVDVSPSTLVDAVKSDLEIVPDPLHREHWQYMAEHPAQFIVRFKGRPLANHAVTLSTGNRTQQEWKTNNDGRLLFTLPDDFLITHAGFRQNKPVEMLLDTSYELAGRTYRTTLSAKYIVNPAHWKSVSDGVLVAGGGMLIGGLISWRIGRKQSVTAKNRGAGS